MTVTLPLRTTTLPVAGRRRSTNGKTVVLYLWLPVVLVALWWFVSPFTATVYMPALSTIVDAGVTAVTSGRLLDDLAFSMSNYLAGLAIAAVLGIAFGLVLGEVPVLRVALTPVLDFMRTLPIVSIVPMVIVAFGLGREPKIAVIAFACFWPILLNTIAGTAAVPASVHEMSRSYTVPFGLRLRAVILPGAAPAIFTGLRIALAAGIVMVVVSEMFGSTTGIGFFILNSAQLFRVADTWAGALIIGIIGYVLSVLLGLVEHRVLRWRPTGTFGVDA